MNKQQLKKDIMQYITDRGREGVAVSDITKALNNHETKLFQQQVKALAELEQDNYIELTKEGRCRLKEKINQYIGRFSGTDRGFGFVVVDDEEMDDIFIPPNQTLMAFNGDLVEVEVTESSSRQTNRSAEGRVVSIIERHVTQAIGEFIPYTDKEVAEFNLYGYVKAKVKKAPEYIIQIQPKGLKPSAGEIVQVDITRFPTYKGEDMLGVVVKTIGYKDEPGIDILSIAHKHGLRSEFPQEVIDASASVPDHISPEDVSRRRDLRQEMIITIDGADAKDLDDAVCVKKQPNGHFRLGVHIADVSHYVGEDSPLDKEAYERGTSAYLTDRVIPMLPQRLSNGICSLHPNVDRLTLSCEMEINKHGEVVDYTIYPSVIQSKYRMTYHDVNCILEDGNQSLRETYQLIVPMLEEMKQLHQILEHKRRKRGAIDFDSDEAKIILDSDGTVTDIELRQRGVGERLIESFMLIANETVSKHYSQKQLPIIYRVHDRPDESKIKRFLEFITTFGLSVKATKDTITSKDLQYIMDQVKGEPYEAVINMLLLRSMQQAKYDVDPIGHYGLGADFYSHFTSPIRRYPDLILHRLIHYYDEIGCGENAKKRLGKRLPDIAEMSSKAERRAIDAERETDELKKVEFMADKIDRVFIGTIVSITGFGMFVQLPNTIEGLVHVSMMKDDYYRFDEQHLIMIGERTKKIFRIGQTIEVKVLKADSESRQIDFDIVQDYADKDTSKVPHQKKKFRKPAHKSKRNLSKKSKTSRKGESGKRQKK